MLRNAKLQILAIFVAGAALGYCAAAAKIAPSAPANADRGAATPAVEPANPEPRAQQPKSQPYVPTTGLKEWHVGPNGVARMNLVTSDSPTAMNAFRIRYPKGLSMDSGSHYHLGTEHIVVLQGKIWLGFGEVVDISKAKAYGPGDFIEIPAGMAHFEWFEDEVIAHVEHVGPLTAVWINHRGTIPSRGR